MQPARPTAARLALSAVLAAAGAAPAARAAAATPAAQPFEFRIGAGKAEELCFALPKGRGVDYRFEADAPVDFNVHYHAGARVVTPVDARAVERLDGRYLSGLTRDVCLMWSAPRSRAAVVRGRVDPVAARR